MRASTLNPAQEGMAARAALTAALTVSCEAACPRQTTACVTGFLDENSGPSLVTH